jgi:hypothetical protein
VVIEKHELYFTVYFIGSTMSTGHSAGEDMKKVTYTKIAVCYKQTEALPPMI